MDKRQIEKRLEVLKRRRARRQEIKERILISLVCFIVFGLLCLTYINYLDSGIMW